MWLFTKYGFYSAVCARVEGSRLSPIDPNRIAVRARFREHLESLIRRFPSLIGDAEIRSYSGTDYQFRIFIPKKSWSAIVSQIADEIRYDNFKSEAESSASPPEYVDALHDVWQVVWSSSNRD